GTIHNAQTITVNSLAPGTYTATETAKTGWPPSSPTGHDGSSATASSGDTNTRTATFKVDPGETVTCTFTNSKQGSIIVKKLTNPSGDAATFVFTGDASGTIGDTQVNEVDHLVPGTYTST